MSSDSLKDRREQSLLDRVDRRTVGIAVVVVVAIAGVAAAALLLTGDSSTEQEAGEGLELVPQDVDGVIRVNGSVTDDPLVTETLSGGNDSEEVGALDAGWWLADEGESPSLDEILSLIGDDSIGYENTTAFFKSGTETPYAGAVVEVESNSSAIVGLVEDEVGELNQSEYKGETINEISVEQAAQQADVAEEYDLTGLLTQFIGNDTRAGVATLDDQTAVLGSRAAVEDVIDIQQENAEPLSPDSEMRTAHERAPDGQIKLTVNVSLLPEDVTLSELTSGIDTPMSAGLGLVATQGEGVELISGAYTPRDREAGTATLHVQAMTPTSEGAKSLIDQFKSFYSEEALNQVKDDPESIRTLQPSARASASQKGRYVNLEIPETPDRVIGYVTDIVDKFGPQFVEERNASALVPQRATSVQSIDNPDVEGVTEAVAFQGEDGYVGTVAKVSDSEAMLDEIGNQTDGNLSQREEEYRLVTVHELSGSEPDVTAALSGEGTPDTEWVAPIGGDFVVFGTEQAVKDSIDIYRGVSAPNQDL